MSTLVIDSNKKIAQAFRLPEAGLSTSVPLAVAGSIPSAVLSAGMYRIIPSADVTVALGAIAAATDMPMRANQVEHFYVNANSTVSFYIPLGVAGATAVLTRMP